MKIELPISVVFTLLGIQVAVFGWRINREIAVVDKKDRGWLPLSDLANIVSMLSVLILCIIYPLSLASVTTPKELPLLSRAVFAAAATLLMFHPVAMSGHYGLLPGQKGKRPTTKNDPKKYKYFGKSELGVNLVAWVAAFVAGRMVYSMAFT
jgi:hypothetical protein